MSKQTRLEKMMVRIGHGVDVHKFAEGDHVVLGAVRIPFTQGLEAHSDGDVVLHALCDALLGAAGLGDIGKHFPDSDEKYAGIASSELLKDVFRSIREPGYHVQNVDISIMAQLPKLAPHIEAMRAAIATLLGCELEQINVKATTTEGLGYIGRGEGIAAHAVVLIAR